MSESSSSFSLMREMEGFRFVKRILASEMQQILIVQEISTSTFFVATRLFGFKNTEMNIQNIEHQMSRFKKISHPSLSLPVKYLIHQIKNTGDYILTILYDLPSQYENIRTLDSIFPLIDINSPSSDIDFQQALIIIFGLISSLECLHNNKIFCGCIIPQFILLDSQKYPFLTSFATYCFDLNNNLDSFPEEDFFSSPEFSQHRVREPENDMFSLSMIVYKMFHKEFVFPKESNYLMSVREKIQQGFRPIISTDLPQFIISIIQNGWSSTISKRPSINALEKYFLYSVEMYMKGVKLDKFNNYFEILRSYLSFSTRSKFSLNLQNIHQLSAIGKKIALKYANMEERIIGISFNNYPMVFQELKQLIHPKSDKPHLVEFFGIAAYCRYASLDLLLKLFMDVCNINNEFNDLPLMFLTSTFNRLLYQEPLPLMQGPMNFVFLLFNKRIYTHEDIISKIKFVKENANAKTNVLLPFCWFANVVYKHERNLYNELIDLLKKHSEDDFFPEPYRNFYKDLNEYKKDNWNFYRNLLPKGKSLNEMKNIIRFDNPKEFSAKVSGLPLPLKIKLPADIFEPCALATDSIFIQLYTVLYGSALIFYQLATNKSLFISTEKSFRKLFQFAVVGGNNAIIQSSEQLKSQYAGSPQIAASYHRNEVFQTILKNHPDLTQPDKYGKIVITTAAASNNIFMLLQCLQLGMDINTKEPFGWTALHAACEKGRIEMIKILLEMKGIDLNAPDIWGCTPLHVATDNNQAKVIHMLLKKKGVNVNPVNEDNKTPFLIAVQNSPPEIISMFLNCKGVDINARGEKDFTALHYAAKRSLEVFQLIVGNSKKPRIDVKAVDCKGRTVMDIAKKAGKMDIVQACEQYITDNNDSCRI